ncbi:MAG TPA: hypothetical protein VGF25_05405 [Thermoleophilaceae bacterium]|jgi:hypothetical protein
MEPDLAYGLSDDDLAPLARLADGTLSEARRAEVEAGVAASPWLASIVERQVVALDALRSTADTGAPARLRVQIERRRAGRAGVGERRKHLIGGAVAVAAIMALALVLVLPAAFSDRPTVADAAALAQQPPTEPAPTEARGAPQLLRAQVEGVRFPNYAAKFGWKPVGARRDHPSGRVSTTVYYGRGGRTIAYTIVSGDPLDPPYGARVTTRGGVEYHSFRDDGRTIVTWRRDGRTCVLSGRAVRTTELLELADWRGKGAVRF